MRLVSDEVLAEASAKFAGQRYPIAGYVADALDHPVAGECLRNYAILTEAPDILSEADLSPAEIFWSRYYWLARFTIVWSAVAGFDAGLEQQLFQLLETAPDGWECLPEVEESAQRAAWDQLRTAGFG